MTADQKRSKRRHEGGLVISRKPGESVTATWTDPCTDGSRAGEQEFCVDDVLPQGTSRITIKVLDIRPGRVVIWLGADRRVKFLRSELPEDASWSRVS